MKKEDLVPQPYAYYQQYEEYFNKVKFSGFKISQLTTSYPFGTGDEFISKYHTVLKEFQWYMFGALMRIEWADRKINYNGRNILSYPTRQPGIPFNVGMKFFYENYLGFSRKAWSDGYFRAIRSYADSCFPEINDIDGFNYRFDFPYQYMTLEAMHFVHKLEFRMELLAEGEKMRLSLPKFCDFVGAYITDVHIKTGKTFQIYYQVMNEERIPYVNEKLNFVERMKRKQKRAERAKGKI